MELAVFQHHVILYILNGGYMQSWATSSVYLAC